MGYYHGEQSLGLGPILITLSLVVVMGFGLLYYAFGRTSDTTSSSSTSASSNSASAPDVIPSEPVQSAAPSGQPALASKTHNHV